MLEGRAPVCHGYARGCVRTYISGSFKELNLANSAVKSEGNEDELTHKDDYLKELEQQTSCFSNDRCCP